MKNILLLPLVTLSIQLHAGNIYKGAEIYSNSSVLYGKFEMCMQASNASGVLSTFFLYKNGSEVQGAGWEEIDIEIFGKNNALSFQSNIITGTAGATINSEAVHKSSTSLADDFHTYSLEWTPDYIAWYLDGVQVRKTNKNAQVDSCYKPMSYRFNTWISNSIPWVGAFDANTLPLHQFVESLSYSSYTKGTGDNGSDFTLAWTDDFSSFNTARWSKANWTFNGNLVDYDPANASTQSGKLALSITPAAQTSFNGTAPSSTCANNTSTTNIDTAPSPRVWMNNHILQCSNFENASAISITDLNGKNVYIGKTLTAIPMEHLSPGIYIVSISEKNSVFSTRIKVD